MIMFLFTHYISFAQVMEGSVMDNESKNGIAGVSIMNKNSKEVVISDADGHYTIRAYTGDTLLFSHVSYQPVEEVMTFYLGNKYKSIMMQAKSYLLKNATIISHSRYEQDSIEKHNLYGHELTKTIVPKPKFIGGIIGCSGCIGWAADKITGNSKKPKQFKKQFAKDDINLFIDSRYTPRVVAALIPLKDTDSIAAFIYAYPMEYGFARSASDLEIKAWIRENYREYIQFIYRQN